jgi:hypothetical protein
MFEETAAPRVRSMSVVSRVRSCHRHLTCAHVQFVQALSFYGIFSDVCERNAILALGAGQPLHFFRFWRVALLRRGGAGKPFCPTGPPICRVALFNPASDTRPPKATPKVRPGPGPRTHHTQSAPPRPRGSGTNRGLRFLETTWGCMRPKIIFRVFSEALLLLPPPQCLADPRST